MIPGKNGDREPGRRQINYVWYDNASPGARNIRDTLTDPSGHVHRNTLPMGAMRPEVWTEQKKYAAETMTPVFLELVEKTQTPFVSTIRERRSPRASYYDGKVLLVGEALKLMRPHTGMSFNQSAVNCLTLQQVLLGDMDLQDWERRVLEWAEWSSLLATAIGEYFMRRLWNPGSWITVCRLLFVLLRQRLVKFARFARSKL